MQHHHAENQQAGFNNLRTAAGHHGTDNQHDGKHGNQRQHIESGGGLLTEQGVRHHAQHDGQQHHLQNGDQHCGGGNIDPLVGKQEEYRRGEQGCEQGADGGNGHGERHVAAREKGHYVGGGAAGAGAHQHHADGHFRRQIKGAREQVGGGGHNHKLCHHADEYGFGVLAEDFEVGGGEGEPHAEHNDAQKPGDVGGDEAGEEGRRQEAGHGKQRCPQGKGVADEAAESL